MIDVVIKYGGSLLEDKVHQKQFLQQVAAVALNMRVILVHGGGKEITEAMAAAGIAARFVDGRRFTDPATLAVVEDTLRKVNERIVANLNTYGAQAKGYSGRVGHLMIGRALPGLGRVGEPVSVHKPTLESLLAEANLPVFFSVAEDEAQAALNINADDFALAIATAARAERLIFLTDTGAILDKRNTPLARLTSADVDRLIDDQTISGGMAVKAKACSAAVAKGVARVDIAKSIDMLLKGESAFDGTSFLPS